MRILYLKAGRHTWKSQFKHFHALSLRDYIKFCEKYRVVCDNTKLIVRCTMCRYTQRVSLPEILYRVCKRTTRIST